MTELKKDTDEVIRDVKKHPTIITKQRDEHGYKDGFVMMTREFYYGMLDKIK